MLGVFIKLLPITIAIGCPSFMTEGFTIEKVYSRMYSALCTYNHNHDVKVLADDGMV